MKTRIASVDYLTFMQCYKHRLWGANNVSITKWSIGDVLVFKVKNELLGIARIDGETYMDNIPIWSNGLFWNRISLQFIKFLPRNGGVEFETYLKPYFIKEWGNHYGWTFLNKRPMTDKIANVIMKEFDKKDGFTPSPEEVDAIIDSLLVDDCE